MVFKRFVPLCAALLVAASIAHADPVEGYWQTEVDGEGYAHVKITTCGAAICGSIARTFDGTGEVKTDLLGKPIVWDMQAQGGGKYAGGKIWQPSTDKVFNSKMVMTGNQLKVSGCVGPICKAQTWKKVQ